MKTLALLISVAGLTSLSSSAAIIAMNLQGKGGIGLLSTNETATTTGGLRTGGEVGAGITYNDISNLLIVNVSWAVADGFSGLTGNVSNAHIHKPTPSSGIAAFNETAPGQPGLFTSPTLNKDAASGGVNGFEVTLTDAEELELLDGRWYLNFHTTTNTPGEIRGNIVVPEPSGALLGLIGAAGLLLRKRRQ